MEELEALVFNHPDSICDCWERQCGLQSKALNAPNKWKRLSEKSNEINKNYKNPQDMNNLEQNRCQDNRKNLIKITKTSKLIR